MMLFVGRSAIVFLCLCTASAAVSDMAAVISDDGVQQIPDLVRDQRATWKCDTYNTTEQSLPVLEIKCYGQNLRIPKDLAGNVYRFSVVDSDIKVIHRDDFQPYRMSLRDVTFSNLHSLRVVEPGTFRDTPNLRSVYISHAPKIKFLDGLFDGITSKSFLSLRIMYTSLVEIPDLSNLQNENILHMIDLEGNKIDRVRSNSMKINAEQVILNNNEIIAVEDFAFNGSRIGKLSLRGNVRLADVDVDAFRGLNHLSQLDLSETAIESLPSVGLTEMEVLKIENTRTMKVIPSVYDFPNLKEAYLTHAFHCCAFRYPEQHNPRRHAEYEAKIRIMCKEDAPNFDTGQPPNQFVRKKRNKRFEEDTEYWGSFDVPDEELHFDKRSDPVQHLNYTPPLRGKTIEHHEAKPLPKQVTEGNFHDSSAEVHKSQVHVRCGNLTIRTSLIACYPEPNALNPCEDIMGSNYLRISVWFVVVLAVVGNLAVIVVVLFSGGEVTVSRFLMCNLALADFCMGLYLLLIASMDLHSMGVYFNFAFDWQYGLGCQMAGFLTMFASQLSIFTLTLVTVERWFAIAYAIYLTRRIRLGVAAKIMVAGWLYSILMAAMPLLNVSNYSSTSICLPMEVNTVVDKAYLISVIVINGLAFSLIVFCYAQIYFSLGYETRRCSTRGEMTIAKKMALLVFTDFVCWAPIAFFALTALAGYPLIGVTRSKILLVFFYPLNSCANPYLYAIMTAQYRKDFFVLLYRCGICSKKAKQYALNSSLPTTNNSHPIPLLTRTSHNNTKQSNVDDAFV